jgi:hypothetical protein
LLYSLPEPDDLKRITVIAERVQDVDLNIFKTL